MKKHSEDVLAFPTDHEVGEIIPNSRFFYDDDKVSRNSIHFHFDVLVSLFNRLKFRHAYNLAFTTPGLMDLTRSLIRLSTR